MKPTSFSELVSHDDGGLESYLRGERYGRAASRYKVLSAVLVTNLTQVTQKIQGWLLDVSTTGMRINAALPFSVGDAVRVDLAKFMVLAEVIHVASVSDTLEVGLKLIHSLDREQLDKFVKSLWSELLGSQENPRPKTVASRLAPYAPDG
jgi:PilZ domain-containing protein